MKRLHIDEQKESHLRALMDVMLKLIACFCCCYEESELKIELIYKCINLFIRLKNTKTFMFH